MTERSAVPEWFGRAAAQGPAVNKASSGCVMPLLLLALAVSVVTAGFGMIEHQRAERLERQLRAATTDCQEIRARSLPVPAPPVPVEPTPPPTAQAPAATPEPSADPDVALPAAEIMKVMNRARPALRACYNAAPIDSRGSGRVMLSITIARAGNVTVVQAERIGPLLPAVATCVTQVVRSLKFPEASSPTTVSYPVVFQSG